MPKQQNKMSLDVAFPETPTNRNESELAKSNGQHHQDGDVALADLFADERQGPTGDDERPRIKADPDTLPRELEAKLEDDSDPEDLKPSRRMRHPRAAHGHERSAATLQQAPAKPSTSRDHSDTSDDGEESDKKPDVKITKSNKKRNKVDLSQVQLISHLPVEEEQARASFVELKDCTYANKTIGNVIDEDISRCDCTYDPDWPLSEQACGPDAQCVNRLMLIECTKGTCRCKKMCQNQRFQKYQYANIEIVRTEKKGYGVRAVEDMPADTFVYEYIGEVIGPTVFARKMKEYADEGIRHFYFMSLHKDTFIDATKKGGLGRFLNHSCNPNCYVSKWTVGDKMRMGIFTKRDIRKDEELTFNYNVDRYGHDAQECFCGEPNCVGYIGGKTQTDLGGMDDLYLDALGIADEVEALGLKGNKKKKGRKLDEDFIPTMRPIEMTEVATVAAAARQALQNRRILVKLLTRYQITEDDDVQRQLLRLHGFNCMTNILREYPDDLEILTLDLQILNKWPLKARNKVESSKVEEPVKTCAAMDDDQIKSLANQLLETWSKLEMAYRIPKAIAVESGADGDGDGSTTNDGRAKRAADQDFSIEQLAKRARLDAMSTEDSSQIDDRPVFVKPEATAIRIVSTQPQNDIGSPGPNGVPGSPAPLPDGWKAYVDQATKRTYYHNAELDKTSWDRPRPTHRSNGTNQSISSTAAATAAADVNDIVARIQKEAEAKAAAEEAARREAEEAKEATKRAKAESRARRAQHAKEKKVMGLFSALVVSVMSKYKSHLEPGQFKKRARELTDLLVEKEKKHPNFANESYDKLSSEKQAKVKSFAKDWTKKLIERQRQRSKSTASSHSTTSSSSSKATSHSHSSQSTRLTTASPATPGGKSISGASGMTNGATPTNGNQAEDDEDAALIASMVADVGNDDDEGDMEMDDSDHEDQQHKSMPPPPPPAMST